MLHRAIASFILLACTASALGAPLYGVQLQKTWIPMHDGVRLAVTLYRPAGAPPGAHFPALLEYLPYRKDDDEAARDFGNHSYFARHGYVGARVDVRGFGNSEGTPPEREYSAQEQQDGDEIIAWLAHQSWSNGSVGMLGISWGGFNSIQMALRNPPALKAIIACAATEELYKEDVHYMDGVFHVDEFELTMDLDQGRPGAPDFSLDESVIGPRMNSEPWSLNYMKHQRDGAFWRSPLKPLDQMRIPAFLIGGMQDGYRDSIIRMLDQVKSPLKAWIGPWNHGFPNEADYGPLYEWRDQAVRWFDYWLKGKTNNGVMNEPRLVIYQQHWHAPGSQSQDVPGEWRAESWPPAQLSPTKLYLQPEHLLSADAAKSGRDELRNTPSMGVEAGLLVYELNADQRSIDAFSLTYDSAPLTEEFAIMGLPQVTLQASSSAPLADWFVRLSDVAPDGQVTLVTGAGLNGAQRKSMADPVGLAPGQVYPLALKLHLATWVFPAGHRIRIAVSNALWPMNWPTPYPLTSTLVLGGTEASSVELPRVPLHGSPVKAFAPPEPIETPDWMKGNAEGGSAWPGEWTELSDEVHGHKTVVWQGKANANYPWGRFDHSERLTYDIDDAHPDAARVQGDSRYDQAVPGHLLTWIGKLDVTSDEKTFFYHYTRTLLRDGTVFRTKEWKEEIPRDHQ